MRKNLLLILFLFFTLAVQAQYYLEWKEYAFLEIPDPPYNGYVAHATWNVNNSNITFDEADEAGAIIYPNHYFEGTSIVTCNYRYEYYRNGRYQTGTSVASYSVTFKSKNAVLDNSEISLNIGQTATIKASFPGGISISNSPMMKWESSDDDIVVVNDNPGSTNWTARIKAVASGKAKVTFDPIIGPPVTCVVNVAYISPQTAKLTPNPLNVTVGKTKKMAISYAPEGASAKKVTWESLNTDIATVTSSGTVKGVAEGETAIVATTDNGVVAKANVIVSPLPLSVYIPNTMTMPIGYSRTIVPTISPSNSETLFKWETSDASVATVSSGVVTGNKEGKTTITVITENGKTASCEVTIQRAPLELNYHNVNNRIKIIESLVKRSVK